MVIRGVLVFVGVMGLLLLGMAARFAWSNVRFLKQGQRTRATVVSCFRRSFGRGTRQYVRVDFTLGGGPSRRAEGEVAFKYVEGEMVEIAVLPDAPDEVLVVHWFSNWWLPALLTIFGLGLGWLGFAQFFRR